MKRLDTGRLIYDYLVCLYSDIKIVTQLADGVFKITTEHPLTNLTAKFPKDPDEAIELARKIRYLLETDDACSGPCLSCAHLPESTLRSDCTHGAQRNYKSCYMSSTSDESCATCDYSIGDDNCRDASTLRCQRYPKIRRVTKSHWCGEYKHVNQP